MYCPRCGAESEEGSRYCASCGADLPGSSGPGAPETSGAGGVRQFLGRLIGSTTSSRLISLGILVALVVAVVAFFALQTGDQGYVVPQDAVTKQLDTACIDHKGQIAAAQRLAIAGGGLGAVSRYSDSTVRIVGEWRMELGNEGLSGERGELVDALASALLEVQIEAGTLARAARESNQAEVTTSSSRVDAATTEVEAAVNALELEHCRQLTISEGHLVQQ